MESVECPYCEEYVDIDPSSYEHYENEQEYECPNCSKNFEVYAEPTINYSVVGKADCLNGADHKWKPRVGIPSLHFRGKYRCEDCSATKTVEDELATADEWNRYFANGCKE